MKQRLLLTAIAITLSGCATQGPANGRDSAVLAAIKESNEKIASAWNDLAAVEKSRAPAYQKHTDDLNRLVDGMPSEMKKQLDLSWNGDISQFVLEMAEAANYRPVVSGRIPATPILVFVRGRMTIADALREAGVQAGDRAGVIVRPYKREVELTFVAGAPNS